MNTSLVALLAPRRLALLAGCVAALASPLAADTEENINRTLDVTPGGNLVVDISAGGIDVVGTTGSQVVIEFTRKVSAGSEEEEKRILAEHVVTIDQTGNTVSIRARGPNHGGGGSFWKWMFGGGTSRKFHLKVSVPEQFNVDLKTAGGGIDIARLTGTVKSNTSGGGLDFADITGDIKGHTSGGGIDLNRCIGDVDVSTSGGGIRADDGEGPLSLNTSGGGISVDRHRGDVKVHTSGGGIHCGDIAGNVDAHTSGGSIRVELTVPPTGDCRFDTSGGGITVTVPGNVAINLDASTSGGSVSTELPVTITGEQKRSRLRGTVNGGGPELHLRSSGGSISINRGPDASVALER